MVTTQTPEEALGLTQLEGYTQVPCYGLRLFCSVI